ncbi:MAG: hypothetical protein AAGA46_00340 [Cyanobacteria bacterium P01_F01_bin.13]
MANLDARLWTVSIEILGQDLNVLSGPHSYTGAELEVQVDLSEINTQSPDTYTPWTAQVSLLNGIAPFSLDNRDTLATPTGAALLAEGNRVDLRIDDGTGTFVREWPPLYILRTPSALNPEDASVTLELGDIGQLFNRQTPEGDYTDIELGTETAPHIAINNILSSLGLPNSPDTIATGYNLSAPVVKYNLDSRFQLIGQIAAANGHYSWFDKNEDLRLTPIDLAKTTPDVTISIGGATGQEDGEGWLKSNLDERPPEEMTVIGGSGAAVAIENPTIINTTVPGDGYTALTSTETTTITAGGGAPSTTIDYSENQATLQIQPKVAATASVSGLNVVSSLTDNTITTLVDSEDRITTHEYNGITRALKKTTIVQRLARGLAGGDAFRDSENSAATSVIRVVRTVITYDYDNITGRVKEIIESRTRPWAVWNWGAVKPPNYQINRFLDREDYRRTTQWARVAGVSGANQNERWGIDQITLKPRGELFPGYQGNNPDTLIEVPNEQETFKKEASDGSTEPPATIYQDPLYVLDEQQHSATVAVTPLAGNAHKLEPQTVDVRAPVVVSGGQCSFLCRLLCDLRHGRSLGRLFRGETPALMFSDFNPGWRIDASADGETRAYFLNGLTIAGDNQELLFSCGLGEIGLVGVTPDVVTPPISITEQVRLDITLPAVEVVPAVVQPVQLDITLPPLAVDVIAATPEQVQLDIVLPALDITPSVVAAPQVQLDIVLPALVASVSNSSTDPDADAFIARLGGSYTQVQLDAIDAFFVALKNDGLYDDIDFLYIMALQTAADGLLNIKGTNYTGVNNGMTFAAGVGFTGNGTTSYIDTGFNPVTAGGNYSQNSASMGVLIGNDVTEDKVDMGHGDLASAVDTQSLIITRGFGNAVYGRVNQLAAVGDPIANSSGLTVASRSASNAVTAYRDGSSVATASTASTAMLSQNIYIGAANNGGATFNSSKQFRLALVASGWDATQNANFDNAVDTLLAVL